MKRHAGCLAGQAFTQSLTQTMALGLVALLALAGAPSSAATPTPASAAPPAAHASAPTPGVDSPPPAAAPRPVVVPPFVQQRLPNGLTVVVAPRHDTPLVTIAALVRAGPEQDPAGRSGTAAMTAALLGKGAVRAGRPVSATQLAHQAEALGGTLDTASSWRSSTLTMTVTTPRLAAATALLADVLRRPTLAADELERARAQALDSLRVSLSDPAAVADRVARRVYWGSSAYGKAVTPASLKRIRRADVQAFHAAAYRPSNTVLVLAGDVQAEQAVELARRLLADWQDGRAPAAAMRPTPPTTLPDPLLLIDLPGSGQSGVVVTAPFVAADAADRRIGQVANAVLGGGYSARLNQEVRIKRGLSYGAFSEAETHPGAGMALASTQTNHPNAAQVLQLLRGEIERLAEAPPGADELAARQATLIGSFARRLETTGGLASLVAAQLAQGRPLDDLRRTVDEISAVTPAEVQGFARTHWRGAALRGVVAGDLKAAGEALATLAGPARRIPAATLDLDAPTLAAP